MPSSTTGSDPVHRRELGRLGIFLGWSAALAGATYLLPPAHALRPWLPGESVPLAHLMSSSTLSVREEPGGELALVREPVETLVLAQQPPEDDAGPAAPPLPHRPPAFPTPMEAPPGTLDYFFQALSRAAGGEEGVVRVLHFGDSTIAADGITGTIRTRLQERFGDGGPGFLAIKVDPRWQLRPGIMRAVKGPWASHDLTFGGASSRRYGLGGIVSTIEAEGTASLGGLKLEGERQPLHRFQVFYQARPGGGTLLAGARGHPGRSASTGSQWVHDRFLDLEVEEGAPWVWLKAMGDGPVTVYGAALETGGPGVTWETLGVAGASVKSILAHQIPSHLEAQVAHREPHLLVYQTGGNELGYPSLHDGDGAVFKETYAKVVERLRAGAPEASCLLLSPLDQATRERGKVVSKAGLDTLIRIQAEVAEEQGCAFWSARAAMGGDGGFARWLEHRPAYAWTDLAHLTTRGLDLVGDVFTDALLQRYGLWEEGAGAATAAESTPGSS